MTTNGKGSIDDTAYVSSIVGNILKSDHDPIGTKFLDNCVLGRVQSTLKNMFSKLKAKASKGGQQKNQLIESWVE